MEAQGRSEGISPNIQQVNPSQSTAKPTYSEVTVQCTATKKEHAIVLDSIEKLSIDDYSDGLEKLTGLNIVK